MSVHMVIMKIVLAQSQRETKLMSAEKSDDDEYYADSFDDIYDKDQCSWTEWHIGIILSIFYVGFGIGNLSGFIWMRMLGARCVVLIGTIGSCLGTILIAANPWLCCKL